MAYVINRKKFFDALRKSGAVHKSLKQRTVETYDALFDAWEKKYPGVALEYIAYSMATVAHEAWDYKNQQVDYAIKEYGGESKPYAPWYGRGPCQLTHKENYAKAQTELGLGTLLTDNPDAALRKDIGMAILVEGMVEGWFRSDSEGRQKLSRYFNEKRKYPYGAREIINGDKAKVHKESGKKMGVHLTDYYNAFLNALKAATAETPPVTDDEMLAVRITDSVMGAIKLTVKEAVLKALKEGK